MNLTRDDILNMPAGPELHALVAKHVMEWEKRPFEPLGLYWYRASDDMPLYGAVRYMGGDQNIWDFPRLYVDGGSWIWLYAIGIPFDSANDD